MRSSKTVSVFPMHLDFYTAFHPQLPEEEDYDLSDVDLDDDNFEKEEL